MKRASIVALSALSLGLMGCGSDGGDVNQPGSLSLSGTAKEGETLTASVNDPDGIDESTLVFTWFADGSVIAGATGATYTLTVNEAGARIRVAVTYVDMGNTREGFTTQETDVVEALPVNFEGVITILGSATVGQTLSAEITDDNGLSGEVAFSWLSDGVAIEGATTNALELLPVHEGTVITAMATYVDDGGFDESITSAPTSAVAPIPAENEPGTFDAPITGMLSVGSTLVAPSPVDANGVSGDINYQWQSREVGQSLDLAVNIDGATEQSFVVTEADLGKVLSVNVSYVDDANYEENLSKSADDQIFTFYVQGEVSLTAALANAQEGDSIGIADVLNVSDTADDYEDMAELSIAQNNLLIKRVAETNAVISGTTCIAFSSSVSGVVLDGLVFEELVIPVAGSCGEGRGSIDLNGSGNVIKNSSFLSDSGATRPNLGSSDESHYITVSGTDNIIERNLFTGKSVNEAEEGSAISMFLGVGDSPNTLGDHQRNIVQYNLFKDFLPTTIDGDGEFDTDSGSHAVQVGRSGSGDGAGRGEHIVRYNRFDRVLMDRGLIIVQGGGNSIHANTIVNSWGNVELRNGYGNDVSGNIIISSGAPYTATVDGVEGTNNKDGGIAFTPLGHTITDNFVANVITNSSDRAALHIDSDYIDSGNSSTQTLIDAGLDLNTVIARNTILNTTNAIQFEDSSSRDGLENCTNLDYTLDFDNNLIANQSADNNIFGTTSGAGATAIKQDEYPSHGCALDNASDYDNNHIYAQTIADLTPIMPKRDNTALVDGVDGNVLADGTEDGATLSAPTANNLVEGTGNDAGIGASLDSLIFIEETMVGPYSTWEAPAEGN
jgi:poly(beta-D-mannuronate) lyase